MAITNVYLSSSLLACELAWLADLPRIGPLLHPGTIAAAAHAVGQHDPGYATRRFRAHWNTTPRAYRNRIR
ncbi:hypothetical protein ACF1BP_03555 [Streptomyces sp. NPDC014735]|uniref:hypothetical protein n=1 Tax=unclassified Streptomyces TaxID=2593676 RepID=UPI0036F73D93